MAATDARFVPIKNAARRESFVVRNSSGDAVAGVTIDSGLASGAGKALVSKDGAAPVNSTNNVVDVGNGVYHLDLTAAEMNFDTVVIIVRTTTASTQDAYAILYPEPRSIRDLAFPAVTGRSLAVSAAGEVNVLAIAAAAITAAAIATDAIDNDALAANAVTEITGGVWAHVASEPSAVPSQAATIGSKLAWLFTLSRNKRTQTATTEVLRNDADAANIATSTKSDDGTTFIRNEWV